MRNRLPNAVAKVTGAAQRNPGRFAGRNSGSPLLLGEPSPYLNRKQKAVWRKFKAELPWLTEADRAMVDIAAHLREEMEAFGGAAINKLQVYSAILSKLGASPVDQSRTGEWGDTGEPNEFFDD